MGIVRGVCPDRMHDYKFLHAVAVIWAMWVNTHTQTVFDYLNMISLALAELRSIHQCSFSTVCTEISVLVLLCDPIFTHGPYLSALEIKGL